MTNKEALERLKQPFNATPDTDSYFDAKEVAIKSLEKDLSIVEELEKIKTEIIGSCNNIAKEVSDLNYTRKIYVYEQLSEIKGAIDKHISELKGE